MTYKEIEQHYRNHFGLNAPDDPIADDDYTMIEWAKDLINAQSESQKSAIPIVRLSCFKEVWQKWCESKSTQEFDEWLHAQMHEA